MADNVRPLDLIVGTFNHSSLYVLHFSPPTASSPASLTLLRETPAIGGHSWLSLHQGHNNTSHHLYATAWTKPKPSVAAYALAQSGTLTFLNAAPIQNLSGYVVADSRYVYSAGGATGEVFAREADGAYNQKPVQTLDFVAGSTSNHSEERGEVPHGDFGGLRHGAHSVDLSPDGKLLYVADIGRNCVWVYDVLWQRGWARDQPPLKFRAKCLAPRQGDGPRHAWPHPNGKVLYVVQEHSGMVDAFTVDDTATASASDPDNAAFLSHVGGAQIHPPELEAQLFWADEVRLSMGPEAEKPRYIYGSTRGLEPHTKGWVAVWELNEDGSLASTEPLTRYETPTSGGLANAIQPAPWKRGQDRDGFREWLVLTDSQEGHVMMLEFDGTQLREVARHTLGKTEEGDVVGAATGVWII